MNEASGTTAADSGSGTRDLTLQNGARFLGPGEGGGVALDGVDDYVDFGDAFAFAAADGFTFAAWVRHDAFQNYARILYLADDGYSNSIQLSNGGSTRQARVYIKNSGTYKTFITPDGSTDSADLFFPPAATWAHIAFTIGDGVVKLYRDGTTRPLWQTSDGVAANPNTGVVYMFADLGRRAPLLNVSGNYFEGALRDARLYNRALSVEQIERLVASTAPWGHFGSGPIHWWKMDEATDLREAADSGSGSNAPLTLMGDSAVFLGPDAGGGASLPNGDVDNRTSFLDFGSGGITFGAANGLTFAVWVNFETNAWSYILYLADAGFAASNSIQLSQLSSGRRATVYIKNNGAPGKSFTTADDFFPDAGQWAHVAWTVSTDGGWTLYRDGAALESMTSADATAPSTTNYLYGALGRHATHNNGFWLDGVLRDARLYNRALSPDQVHDLHASTAPPV